MPKEIERKFILKPNYNIDSIIQNCPHDIIKDHYFNKYTRLRQKNNKYFITIKSEGNLIRDEYEYEVTPNILPDTFLIKDRYYFKYLQHIFEINLIDNLVLIEVELVSAHEPIQLPEWVGKEVTNNKQYYGYNLFKRFTIKLS